MTFSVNVLLDMWASLSDEPDRRRPAVPPSERLPEKVELKISVLAEVTMPPARKPMFPDSVE